MKRTRKNCLLEGKRLSHVKLFSTFPWPLGLLPTEEREAHSNETAEKD